MDMLGGSRVDRLVASSPWNLHLKWSLGNALLQPIWKGELASKYGDKAEMKNDVLMKESEGVTMYESLIKHIGLKRANIAWKYMVTSLNPASYTAGGYWSIHNAKADFENEK